MARFCYWLKKARSHNILSLLVSDLKVDRHDGIDAKISTQAQALEQSVLTKVVRELDKTEGLKHCRIGLLMLRRSSR